MTRLNDRLAAAWGVPVFIANEGWGGYSTANYLELMLTDRGWHERMQQLQPTWFLIHLGVNDERALRPADDVQRDLATMVELLMAGCRARPERILVARPCYDVWPGAEAILGRYIDRIDLLIERLGLRPGPDFFAAYGADPARWYGVDPVHPSEEGMRYMAELWAEALLRA
ncbi:MAG: SGNH/GDSL hydrolase family protein [Armatimonadetes bacterium]|nr:SGNH/GDSL hydrolase family protein [Armatimonadota bacterium]